MSKSKKQFDHNIKKIKRQNKNEDLKKLNELVNEYYIWQLHYFKALYNLYQRKKFGDD